MLYSVSNQLLRTCVLCTAFTLLCFSCVWLQTTPSFPVPAPCLLVMCLVRMCSRTSRTQLTTATWASHWEWRVSISQRFMSALPRITEDLCRLSLMSLGCVSPCDLLLVVGVVWCWKLIGDEGLTNKIYWLIIKIFFTNCGLVSETCKLACENDMVPVSPLISNMVEWSFKARNDN